MSHFIDWSNPLKTDLKIFQILIMTILLTWKIHLRSLDIMYNTYNKYYKYT